ncbi:SGNH/GDSL hydrolase family protein [Puerhibacterium puerhi]|uniref:SGNH/GDSL hydrolase family protein n=1 Tax=Puerhibacterium puerhi TaxID=2692623 RepID=UPI001358DD7B|nr:SGNH/GDSL hydrolase family protein [Puerhibacterium puerhi]
MTANRARSTAVALAVVVAFVAAAALGWLLLPRFLGQPDLPAFAAGSASPSASPTTSPSPSGTAEAGAGADAETDAVVAWTASPDRVSGDVMGRTVRNLVRTTTAGTQVRVGLSNVFGTKPVTFQAVQVGVSAGDAGVVPGSSAQVTFSGERSVTVPAGARVLSDPVAVTVTARSTVAVSVLAAGDPGTTTGHRLAQTTSYVSEPGDATTDVTGDAFTGTTTSWYWVDSLVVDAPAEGTVVALGDSITDGNGSTPGADARWPDRLATRLATAAGAPRLAVANQGISGNRLLADGTGPSALARFDRDVLAVPGVRTVVVLEGINDIGTGVVTTADQLVAGYRQVLARAHAAGVCVVLGTLTPFEGARYYSPEKDAVRQQVNAWIRTSGEADALADFDAAVRDPGQPTRLLPAYDPGDHLHPNDAGYRAMAEAVDLDDLACAD